MIQAISQSLRRIGEGSCKLPFKKIENGREVKNFPREINKAINIFFITLKLYRKKVLLLKNSFENPGYMLFLFADTSLGR